MKYINKPEPDKAPERFCYAIRKPSTDQRSRRFGIYKVTLPEGKPRTPLNLPQIQTINHLYKVGALTHDDALQRITDLKATLYRERDEANPKVPLNPQNQRVLDAYWEAEYADRDILNPEARKKNLQSALDKLGGLSLETAEKKALQTAVDASCGEANQQRTTASRLNQMLKFLGRGFVLRKKRETKKPVKFLTLQEFEQVMEYVEDANFKALCRAAFITGGRCGELFTLAKEKVNGSSVLIESQMLKNATVRVPKNRKERKAFVIKERRTWLAEWINNQGNRADLRKMQHAATLKRACKKAFPGRVDKHLKFHDLRHSYAIYLIQTKGAPLTLVANSLGNSHHVCEKYYAGFMLTDHGIDHLERL